MKSSRGFSIFKYPPPPLQLLTSSSGVADFCWQNQTRRGRDNDPCRWIESIQKGSNWLSWSKLGWSLLLSGTTSNHFMVQELSSFLFSVRRQFGSRLNAFARQSLVCSKRTKRESAALIFLRYRPKRQFVLRSQKADSIIRAWVLVYFHSLTN